MQCQKILLLRSTEKSQILRCRCWNKINRFLSFVITTNDRTVQRQTCCFGQKYLESTVWFCSNLEKKLKYQHLCGKIETQFSNCLKSCKLRGFFASAQMKVRRTEPSNTQKITYLRHWKNSDAKSLWQPTKTAVMTGTHGALGVMSVHLEDFPSAW